MNLSALAREATPLSEERRKHVLKDSVALAEQATSELRTTSYLLHPPLLDERGLPAALGWLVNGFAERSGIEVELEVAEDIERMSIEEETAIFRVVQESLHNVHRHSGSKTVNIQLRRDGSGLVLEVRDRGNGLTPQPGEAIGVGISGMKERLLQLGGTLDIESNHPGMAVIARLPIK
jgi:signal transduction histidine kinase